MTRDVTRRDFGRASAGGVAGLVLSGCTAQTKSSAADALSDHPPLETETGAGKETDGKKFVQFLKDCTPAERVQLGQSLHMFPSIQKDDFGRFGLPGHGAFADDAKTASPERPIRPASFNEVPPEVVLEAAKAGRVDAELTTPYMILSALVHTCFNEALAATTNRDKINYHGIVQWVAGKKGVEKRLVESATTFDLEQAIAKQCLAKLWDRLNKEQREALLLTIEKKTGTTIADKAAIAAMGGGAAIAALGATVAMTGFAFYTTMAVMISTAAGMLGIALPMSAYVGASSAVALLAGPIGWLLATLAILSGLTYLALPNADKTAAFVMTMNVIKAHRNQAERGK